MKNELKISNEARKFGDLVQAGVEAWVEAGKLLVTRTTADPTFPRQVIAACPAITEETLAAFRRIGQGLVLPTLMLSDSRPGVKALLSRPIIEQEKFDREPVPVLQKIDRQNWETVELPVRDLSRAQSQQVFGPQGLRSIAAQKMWLLNREKTTPKPWEIIGDNVLFRKGCYLSAREIEKILKILSEP